MTDQLMVADLARSGLHPSDISAVLAVDGSGYHIPYWRLDGTYHPIMHRTRLFNPEPGRGKYTQPTKEALERAGCPASDATLPYLPPLPNKALWADLARSAGPIAWWLVEGEKKAACVVKYGRVPAIGFGGANTLTIAGPDGAHHLHPLLAGLIRKGDTVYLAFDADVRTNKNVALGAGTARHCLNKLGINVQLVMLPEGVGGVDDYLMAITEPLRPKALQDLPKSGGADLPVNRATLAKAYDLQRNDKGALIVNDSNVTIILTNHPRYAGKIYYDVIRGWLFESVTNGADQAVTDGFFHREAEWFQRNVHPMIKAKMVGDCVAAMRETQMRNTFKEALDNTPWDNTPRLEEMFIRGWGAADTQYTRHVGGKWLMSVVARGLQPGCRVDTMLVLEGPQGRLKSTSLQTLAGDWYGELTTSMENAKDFLLTAHRTLIADIPELSGLTKSDFTHIKALITVRQDELRAPYERTVRSLKRSFVFTGTTNDKGYLRDPTGNRRFLPIECGNIDLDWIKNNRGQLFAEAAVRYNGGLGEWWVNDALTAAEQANRLATDPWVEQVRHYLETLEAGPATFGTKVKYHFASTGNLLNAVGVTIDKAATIHTQRLAQIMASDFGTWERYIYDNPAKPLPFAGGTISRCRGYRKLVAGQVPVPAPVVDIRSLPPVSPGGASGSDDPGRVGSTLAGGVGVETPGANPNPFNERKV